MDFIFIEGLQLKARVGIYPREQCAPQLLEMELTFGVPESVAIADDISQTIDYAMVIQRIESALEERHFNLLETLGEFVVALLFDEFGAPWVKLRVAKVGVMRNVRRVGVFIQRTRPGVSPPDDLP